MTSRDEAITAFRLLQASLLALRVEKVGAHHGHDHEHTEPTKPKKEKKKKKKKPGDKPKPPQNLAIQRDQSVTSEDEYYAWFEVWRVYIMCTY